MNEPAGSASVLSPLTIRELLDRAVSEDGERVYLEYDGVPLTLRDLGERVSRFATGLRALGVKPGERMAVMLPNHPDYVVAFLAMARIGVCQVPININLQGPSLQYLIDHSALRGIILDARFRDQVMPALRPDNIGLIIARGGSVDTDFSHSIAFDAVTAAGHSSPPPLTTQQDTLLISYTSGTTGMPKGVLVSDKMLQAAGWAAAHVAAVRDGDVLFLWEPIYHIAGCEVLILALLKRVKLALVERFSVSRFWDQARARQATHIHYFGGVLPLLLKEPASARDREHGVRVAWGGGCPAPIWRPFEERFGVRIHECYGMTEASSFTTANFDGGVGSVGKPLPYFECEVADETGRFLGPNERGELWVRPREPGVVMTGYFRNPEATAATLAGGWLHTGDLVTCDADGSYYYMGRLKDSVRRLGENISAWEIERVVNDHPDVAESAVIGVANEIADQDVKIFLRLKPGRALAAEDFIRWCRPLMPAFQVPRYVAFIDEFPKTPTERTRKELLPADTNCWDLEASELRNRRRPAVG